MDVNREREEDRAHEIDEALKSVFADADRADAVKRLREAAKKTEELSDFWGKIGMTALTGWRQNPIDAAALSGGVLLTARAYVLHTQHDELIRMADKIEGKKEAGK
jgi:hypothetical protein